MQPHGLSSHHDGPNHLGLRQDTVTFGCAVGRGGDSFSPGVYSNLVFFSLKAEASGFGTAVEWLQKVLYRTVLDPAILKVQLTKLLSEVPNEKRSTGAMASALHEEAIYGAAQSNHAPMNLLRQGAFLERVQAALEAGAGTPQHGLSFDKMALITSGCGTMRSPSIKWP